MSILDRLFRRGTPPPRRQATADPPPVYLYDGDGGLKLMTPTRGTSDVGGYTGFGTAALNTTRALKHTDYDYALAATQCEYAYRCIRVVAGDISAIPFGVRNRVTKSPVTAHPLLDAMSYARRNYAQHIMELWQVSRMVFGETYLYPVANAFRFNTGLRWLNPLAIEPFVNAGKIEYFDYQPDAGHYRFYPGQIIFDRVGWILDDVRGQGLLSAALDAINIDRQVKKHTLDRFYKGLRMQGILTGRQGSNVQAHEVTSAVEEIKKQAQAPLIAVNAALEFKPIEHPFDGSQLQFSDDARRRIRLAIGVPSIAMGDLDDVKYDSAPEQRAQYAENTLLRETERLTLFINDVVMPYFDPSGENEACFETDELLALIEGREKQVNIMNSRVAAGTATINEARVKAGDKPLPNGDFLLIPSGMIAVPVDQLTHFAQQSMQAAVPALPSAAPALAAIDANKDAVSAAPASGKSACLMLTLPGNPDLIELQRKAARVVGDTSITWNKSDDFHVTLVYMPAVSDEQLEALAVELNGIEVDALTLKVGSLAVFDNVGEHALHYKVRRNEALYSLQADLYDLVTELGIMVSGYSAPDAYDPHITMGYAAARVPFTPYRGGAKVKPAALCLKVDDDVIYERALGESAPPPEPEPENAARAADSTAADELAAWRKKAKNKGAGKAIDFVAHHIHTDIADAIRAALADGTPYAQVFDRAADLLMIKAITGTETYFTDEFSALLADALDGGVNKRSFSAKLRALINTYGKAAYSDGLLDGGVDDELDDDDKAAIALLLAEQSRYVTALADTLYADEDTITPAMAEQKPAMWFNKSIMPFYTEGLLAADRNGMYEWKYGATEHCADCKRLNGQRHRLKDWARRGLLPQSSSLECGGFLCECELVKVNGKAKGSW